MNTKPEAPLQAVLPLMGIYWKKKLYMEAIPVL